MHPVVKAKKNGNSV